MKSTVDSGIFENLSCVNSVLSIQAADFIPRGEGFPEARQILELFEDAGLLAGLDGHGDGLVDVLTGVDQAELVLSRRQALADYNNTLAFNCSRYSIVRLLTQSSIYLTYYTHYRGTVQVIPTPHTDYAWSYIFQSVLSYLIGKLGISQQTFSNSNEVCLSML